ncbi:MAG: class I SAM-dependent DNA methyltransferase, partial [Methylocystis sp.]|nr:class I SAM-dependent DNA methyltransferase [Methylocystis sp.]
QTGERRPHKAKEYFDKLFSQMENGGEFDLTEIAHFNGGLFDGRRALALEHGEIGLLFAAASLDWSLIDPTVFGTLFERFLDPDKRAQIGAHYTDPDKIMMIVEPVVLRPLRREWEAVKAEIDEIMKPAMTAAPAGRDGKRDHDKKLAAARVKAEARRDAFIDRLTRLRVLDPACGSGNFLYLALQGVKDIEYLAISHCELYGLGRPPLRIGPEILRGIEINPFAAELARMTIWIGDIQWSIRNGIYSRPEPILRKLDAIECRDAVLAELAPSPRSRGEGGAKRRMRGRGSEADDIEHNPPAPHPDPLPARGEREAAGAAIYAEAHWPEADFIVGNPPFLGGKLLRKGLGDEYTEALFSTYAGRVPAEADLVCYWFAKAWDAVRSGRAKRVGLVSTNSIRGGANRRVLEPIAQEGAISEAWSDEPWIVEGAAVRVSLVCFSLSPSPHAEEAAKQPSRSTRAVEGATSSFETPPAAAPQDEVVWNAGKRLDGAAVETINADLTGHGFDITQANQLAENEGVSFMGDTKGGAFDIPGEIARAWLNEPLNPNGRPNSDVLRPWVNGLDVTRRPRDMWVIDFGWEMSEREAAMYEAPFAHVIEHVKPERDKNRRDAYKKNWWRHVEPRPAMWAAINTLSVGHGRTCSGHPRQAAAHAGVDARDKRGHDGGESARYIVTARVAKHRIFTWLETSVEPDSATIAIARDDDVTFGVLHSRFHEAWALRLRT